MLDVTGIFSLVEYRLIRNSIVVAHKVCNLVTQYGDQYYGERAGGVAGAPNVITGMQLGTGTTAPEKTGTYAAIETYISGSDGALSAAVTSSLNGSYRRITYTAFWAAGTATNAAISEAVLVNKTLDGTAAVEGETVARAILSPAANKPSDTSLEVVWHHDLLGA